MTPEQLQKQIMAYDEGLITDPKIIEKLNFNVNVSIFAALQMLNQSVNDLKGKLDWMFQNKDRHISPEGELAEEI